ncbi:MAG: sulfite exporter TauE/SafE family protein [Hyphomicrobiaceae bacterium]
MAIILDWQAVMPLVLMLMAVGFLSGFLAGLLGIGGGAVVVIALFEAFSAVGVDPHVRMHLATGTALSTLVPTTLRSFTTHRSRGVVDEGLVRRLAPWIVVGVAAGVAVASRTGGDFLKWVWIVMGTFLGLRMLLGRDDWRLGPEVPRSWLVEAYASFVGFVSALMSIGGGAFVTLLMTLYGRPLHQAVGTSSAFGPLIAVPAVVGFAWAGWGRPDLPVGSIGYVSLIGAALLVPTGWIAAPIGARLAHGLSKRKLEIAFAIFMGCVVLRYLIGFLK